MLRRSRFQWTAGSATQYALTLGSNPKGFDIYSSSQISALSAAVMNLPADSRTVYAAVYSKVGNTWVNNDYTYPTFNGSNGQALRFSEYGQYGDIRVW